MGRTVCGAVQLVKARSEVDQLKGRVTVMEKEH